jgi:hypothetical protein
MSAPETLLDRLGRLHQPIRRDPAAYTPKLLTVCAKAMARHGCAPT